MMLHLFYNGTRMVFMDAIVFYMLYYIKKVLWR